MRKITIEDREKGLYQYYLDTKNNDISKVVKMLLLREDFYSVLDKIYNAFDYKENRNFPGKKIWDYNDQNFWSIINNYVDILQNTVYLEKMNESDVRQFSETVRHFLHHVYTIHFFNVRNNSNLKDQIIVDVSDNYPTVSCHYFRKEGFYKIFNEAFYSQKSLDAYKDIEQKHPTSVSMGGSQYKKGTNIPHSEPQLVQILVNEGTTKQKLIDYINEYWPEMEMYLTSGRPKRKVSKSKADKNFLRDIDIYNKYQDFIESDVKNPDVKTWAWLKNESPYRSDSDIEPNTIAKIVSGINKEIKYINSDK